MVNFTQKTDFFRDNDPFLLAKEYGTPLYVYNESVIRKRCQEMKNLVSYNNFKVNYSAKANSNLTFLNIVREEGLNVDAMSPGEIILETHAGFKPENIFYVPNNVSASEMKFAIDMGVEISVDSLSQLEMYGRLNPGGKIAVRFDPGIGDGHHEKVVTGGKKAKFGVDPEFIPKVKEIASLYNLTVCGINQHIGSLFMDGAKFIEGSLSLLSIAKNFKSLEFVDLGGGFGIPYRKLEGESRLNLSELGKMLDVVIQSFIKEYGHEIMFVIEPGRYISAESSVLLGGVHAIKYNGGDKYIGTDLGFNVLVRPVMYDSHHDIEVYSKQNNDVSREVVTVVGNICESGDTIAKKRELPQISEGDIIGVLDAGAYGHVMSSNYNCRLRPAEVLIQEDGTVKLIRRRDTFEDLLRPYSTESL